MSADMISDARNLFKRISAVVDDERVNRFMWSIVFEGDVAVGYDPEETQSEDDQGPFRPSTYDQGGIQATFIQDQVGLDLDGFPLDHVFPDDYDLKEEDEVDIDEETLFKDELANQAVGVQPKCKSRRRKAYTTIEDKLLCECWRDIGQDPKFGAEQKASTF
ncbi:DNA repair protein rhp54 [Hordeum vulgare]|nr:DNA repair protein rhp54 [Hordeum vulgare]